MRQGESTKWADLKRSTKRYTRLMINNLETLKVEKVEDLLIIQRHEGPFKGLCSARHINIPTPRNGAFPKPFIRGP